MSWIYKNSIDNTSRFILGEIEGRNPLIYFGVNPSTATPNNLDNTIAKVKEFSRRLGFSGWIMLNLYPQRATNPADLHTVIDLDLHKLNLKHIRNIIGEYKPNEVWASWGNLIGKRSYLPTNLKNILDECTDNKIDFFQLDELTIKGHPRHPSRLPYNSIKRRFDVSSYINNFNDR